MMLLEIHAHGKRHVKDLLEQKGKILTMLYVGTADGDFMAMPFKHESPYEENRIKRKILVLIQTLRQKKMLRYVQIVAEAWVTVHAGEEAARKATVPSKDPNRVEGVVLGSFDPMGNKKTSLFHLDRSGAVPTLGEETDWGGAGESWLDTAFTKPEDVLR